MDDTLDYSFGGRLPWASSGAQHDGFRGSHGWHNYPKIRVKMMTVASIHVLDENSQSVTCRLRQ